MNNALHEVFVHTIQDIYNSETQITAALPKMIANAQDPDLREALSNHLGETHEQVRRIEQVCRLIGCEPGGVTCQATAGLIREAAEQMEKFGPGPGGDAAIIACAQKVEHYEMSNYGTVIAWAKQMDHDEAEGLLKDTIEEESKANETLSKIAKKKVNEVAMNAAPVGAPRATVL